jgi:hypothetical protein
MGAAARAVIEDRYSWNASVAHAEEFYDELVDRRAAAVGV